MVKVKVKNTDVTVEQFVMDLDASLDYIDKRKEFDPMKIGICGSSMGGHGRSYKRSN